MNSENFADTKEARLYLRRTFAKYDAVVLLASQLHDKWFENPEKVDEIVQVRDNLRKEMVKVLLNPDPSSNEIEYFADKIEEAQRLLQNFL